MLKGLNHLGLEALNPHALHGRDVVIGGTEEVVDRPNINAREED